MVISTKPQREYARNKLGYINTLGRMLKRNGPTIAVCLHGEIMPENFYVSSLNSSELFSAWQQLSVATKGLKPDNCENDPDFTDLRNVIKEFKYRVERLRDSGRSRYERYAFYGASSSAQVRFDRLATLTQHEASFEVLLHVNRPGELLRINEMLLNASFEPSDG